MSEHCVTDKTKQILRDYAGIMLLSVLNTASDWFYFRLIGTYLAYVIHWHTVLSAYATRLNVSDYSVHSELRLDSQRRIEQIENIEKQSIHKYFAEVPSEMPCPPPNTELSQKAGYLFMRMWVFIGAAVFFCYILLMFYYKIFSWVISLNFSGICCTYYIFKSREFIRKLVHMSLSDMQAYYLAYLFLMFLLVLRLLISFFTYSSVGMILVECWNIVLLHF